jgi:hypothetical protein
MRCRLGQDALQALVITKVHGRCGQGGQLLGDQLAALIELVAHLRQLHPGEVGAEHHRQQGAGQQRQHQYAATNSKVFQHSPFTDPGLPAR